MLNGITVCKRLRDGTYILTVTMMAFTRTSIECASRTSRHVITSNALYNNNNKYNAYDTLLPEENFISKTVCTTRTQMLKNAI